MESENRNDEIDYHAHIYNEMRLLHEKDSSIMLLNKQFAIQRDVWHPSACFDLAEHTCKEVLRLVEEEVSNRTGKTSFDFLQVGCGSGYISVLVALSSEKCRVWATDINEAAVLNAKENAKLHRVEHRVKAVVADVFNNHEISGRKFDMIFWIPPWAGQHTDKEAQLDHPLLFSFIDPGYSALLRFFKDAGSYLKEKGRLLLAFSYKVGSEELFKSIAHGNGWKLEIISSQNLNLNLNGTSNEIPVIMVEFLKRET